VETVLGIVGGSGLYEIDGLTDTVWKTVETPWGKPSDQLLFGRLGDTSCVFLPRHGRGHPLSPTHLNYRANIDALKRSGVTDVISLSAVGSLREDPSVEVEPGQLAIQKRVGVIDFHAAESNQRHQVLQPGWSALHPDFIPRSSRRHERNGDRPRLTPRIRRGRARTRQ